jgi:uncharacterized protein YdcH (DUF465 family)
VINVREVLETHSQATTLRELEAQGRSKVRVINAAEISRLIEAAVRQAIANAGGDKNVDALIERSKTEFRELKRQRDQEQTAREEGVRQLDKARTELETMNRQVGDVRKAEGDSRARAEELDTLLTKERNRSKELEALVAAVTKERDLSRASEKALREGAPALPGQAVGVNPEQSVLLSKLAEQVAKLSDKIATSPSGPAPAAPGVDVGAMHAKLEALSTGIADRLDKFSRSLSSAGGPGHNVVEAEAVRYDKIFDSKEKLESNMGNVEVKQQKGSGIGGTLDRMKKLRLGPSKDGAESKS